MHEWVLFTGIAHIMKGCGCTQYDESSKFVIVKGIIIFKHYSHGIVYRMLNQLTRQGIMLQVALLAEERASWLAAKLNIRTRQSIGSTHVVAIKLLTCIYYFDDTLGH